MEYLNLRAEQAKKKLTNQQTADFIGISRVSYEYKKKHGNFRLKEIKKLCELFNCSFDYLFATKN